MQGQNDQNDQNEQDTCCCRGHDHVHDSGEYDSETDGKTPYIDPGDCRIPTHDGVEVEVVGGKLDPAEVEAYVAYAKRKEGAPLHRLVIHVMGDEVQLEYHCRQPGFQRIRRITGYLVGTIDRFCNSKRAEEHDRVHHAMGSLAHEHTIGQV